MDDFIFLAKGRGGGWGQFLQFLFLFWSFILAAGLKAKIAWAGILVIVAGAFFPSANQPAEPNNIENLHVAGGDPTTTKPFSLRFRGSLRGLAIAGGICIAVYGLYADRHPISQHAAEYRKAHEYSPPEPDKERRIELK